MNKHFQAKHLLSGLVAMALSISIFPLTVDAGGSDTETYTIGQYQYEVVRLTEGESPVLDILDTDCIDLAGYDHSNNIYELSQIINCENIFYSYSGGTYYYTYNFVDPVTELYRFDFGPSSSAPTAGSYCIASIQALSSVTLSVKAQNREVTASVGNTVSLNFTLINNSDKDYELDTPDIRVNGMNVSEHDEIMYSVNGFQVGDKLASGSKLTGTVIVTLNNRMVEDGHFYFDYSQKVHEIADPSNRFATNECLCTVSLIPMTRYYVVSGAVNVRDYPSTAGNRIGGLSSGDVVEALDYQNGWILIDYNGENAWVQGDNLYLTYDEETAISPMWYTVKAGALNVRADADINSERIGGLTAGKKILVTGIRKDSNGEPWLVITYKDQLAYVKAEFLDSEEEADQESAASDTPIEHMSIKFPGDMKPGKTSKRSLIANGSSAQIDADALQENPDNSFSCVIYPDDGTNFNQITSPEKIELPEDCEYIVDSVVHNEDRSICVTFVKENTQYTMKEGEGQSVSLGENKELRFASVAQFKDFVGVMIDDKEVPADQYTAEEGSTIITLKGDFVAKLSEGNHTISIVSKHGTANTVFRILPAPTNVPTTPSVSPTNVPDSNSLPKTGDVQDNSMMLGATVLFFTGLSALFLYERKRKYNK